MSDNKIGAATFFQALLLQVLELAKSTPVAGRIGDKVAAIEREHDKVVAAAEKDVNRLARENAELKKRVSKLEEEARTFRKPQDSRPPGKVSGGLRDGLPKQ